jgi:hypothetical protein
LLPVHYIELVVIQPLIAEIEHGLRVLVALVFVPYQAVGTGKDARLCPFLKLHFMRFPHKYPVL